MNARALESNLSIQTMNELKRKQRSLGVSIGTIKSEQRQPDGVDDDGYLQYSAYFALGWTFYVPDYKLQLYSRIIFRLRSSMGCGNQSSLIVCSVILYFFFKKKKKERR